MATQKSAPGIKVSQRCLAPDLIPSVIPIPNRLILAGSDHVRACTILAVPFKPEVLVQLPQFEIKEKIHQDRHNFPEILSLRGQLMHEIENVPNSLDTVDERCQFLVDRARFLLQITDDMVQELKYPQMGKNRTHTAFEAFWRKRWGKSEIRQRKPASIPMLIPAQIDDTFCHISKPSDLCLNKVDADGSGPVISEYETTLDTIECRLKAIFEADSVVVPHIGDTDFWQFRVKKSLIARRKPKSTKFWKRNSYPPKTEAERVAALRQNASLENPAVDTDLLSGVWIPEFMTSKFAITGINYDLSMEERPGQVLDWYELEAINEKCNKWLHQNLEFL